METKKLLPLLLGLILLGATYFGLDFWASLDKPYPISRESYLIDVTDTFLVRPEWNDIEHRYTESPFHQGRITKVRAITETDHSIRYVHELPPFQVMGHIHTWDLSQNDLNRSDAIDAYEAGVQTTMDSIYADSIGFAQTSFVTPLIEELEYLQGFPKDTRSVIVYGDLSENTLALSFLKEESLRAMQELDPSIWRLLPNVNSLKDLQGITIYFVHAPQIGKRGQRYAIISRYLKHYLEALGANVIIQGKVIRYTSH